MNVTINKKLMDVNAKRLRYVLCLSCMTIMSVLNILRFKAMALEYLADNWSIDMKIFVHTNDGNDIQDINKLISFGMQSQADYFLKPPSLPNRSVTSNSDDYGFSVSIERPFEENLYEINSVSEARLLKRYVGNISPGENKVQPVWKINIEAASGALPVNAQLQFQFENYSNGSRPVLLSLLNFERAAHAELLLSDALPNRQGNLDDLVDPSEMNTLTSETLYAVPNIFGGVYRVKQSDQDFQLDIFVAQSIPHLFGLYDATLFDAYQPIDNIKVCIVDSGGNRVGQNDYATDLQGLESIYLGEQTAGETFTLHLKKRGYLDQAVEFAVPKEGFERVAYIPFYGADFNNDNVINVSDFLELLRGYSLKCDIDDSSFSPTCTNAWDDPDPDVNDNVNIIDFGILKANFFMTARDLAWPAVCD